MKKLSITKLTEFGLSPKEAQLYYSALKLGPATAQQLSYESEIKRATVYGCIDTLIDKGLLHVEIKGTRKMFVPQSPQNLMQLYEQKKQALNEAMPQLMQNYLHSTPSHNAIKVYQGISSIKLLYDHMFDNISAGDEYLVISDQQKWYALDPLYFEEFIKRRAQINLTIKMILQDTSHARKYQQSDVKHHEKIKLLPKKIELNTNMVILPEKVIIVQTIEPLLAIVIDNRNVAAMNRALFHTIWELI